MTQNFERSVHIEDECLIEDILEYSGWKLYKNNSFPSVCRLDDILVKKEENGNLTIKTFEDMKNDTSQYYTSEEKSLNKDEIAFQLDVGTYNIPVESGNVEIQYNMSDTIYELNHSLVRHKTLSIKGSDENVRTFVADVDAYKKKSEINNILIYTPNPKNGYWECLCKLNKRDFDTVFVNKKKEIIDDLEEFISSESDYKLFGHSYKRNYLFYGPPGNGKTSFITAIASKYNFRVYLVSFSSLMTDEIFKKTINTISKNAILVMEDIDVLFTENNKNLSMSAVLNTMDGLARKGRIISIMTTNNFEVLSDVFKRPGRVDMLVEFNKVDENCIKEMAEFLCKYKKIYDIEEIVKISLDFYKKISYLDSSRALIQKFIFDNRRKHPKEIFSDSMVKNFKNLNLLYENKKTNIFGMYS